MELWTITYNINGEPGLFQIDGRELEDNSYKGVVNLFMERNKENIKSGKITSFNVSYTRYYKKVSLSEK